MASRLFKVGDEVAITRSWSAPEIVTVTRVLKQYVETSDGRKWNVHGRERGRPAGYDGPSIVHATDEHRDHAERAELYRKILAWHNDQRFGGRRASTETLRAIVAAIESGRSQDEVLP